MNLKELLHILDTEKVLHPGTESIFKMHEVSQEAQRLTAILNTGVYTNDEIKDQIEAIIGKPVGEGFSLFLPFYTDFGKNLHIGKNVFINSACQFQDQGGIMIGDNCHIGPKTVIATINHGLKAKDRLILYLDPVVLEENVWTGANVVILPGVTVGKNSVIAAGAVVREDVPPNTVVAGVPAKVIKEIKND